MDKTEWHISQTLEIAEKIKQMHLNPYSPEQNPVELLWRELRRKYFHNIIFNSLDDVENILNDALLKYHLQRDDVMKLSNGFLHI